MDEPSPVVVPKVMIRIARVKPNGWKELITHDDLPLVQTPSREI